MKFSLLFIFAFLLFNGNIYAQKQTRKKTSFQMNKISVAQTDESTKKPTNPNRQKAEQIADSPVKILYKPRAAYPQSFDGGTVCIQGTVTLRVQFLDTGKIGEIIVISSLPYGANENAIEAAKKMRFEPAIKNGKMVTRVKVVQFPFTIY